LRVAILQADGTYQQSDKSPSFPNVPLADMMRFLQRWAEMDETAWAKEFRRWVCESAKGEGA
jgi:hypothetical protein